MKLKPVARSSLQILHSLGPFPKLNISNYPTIPRLRIVGGYYPGKSVCCIMRRWKARKLTTTQNHVSASLSKDVHFLFEIAQFEGPSLMLLTQVCISPVEADCFNTRKTAFRYFDIKIIRRADIRYFITIYIL